MKVFYVMARGVYEHGPLGLFLDMEKARERCEQHAADTRKEYNGHPFNGDGHHSYVIYAAQPDGSDADEMAELKAAQKAYGALAVYAWNKPA